MTPLPSFGTFPKSEHGFICHNIVKMSLSFVSGRFPVFKTQLFIFQIVNKTAVFKDKSCVHLQVVNNTAVFVSKLDKKCEKQEAVSLQRPWAAQAYTLAQFSCNFLNKS